MSAGKSTAGRPNPRGRRPSTGGWTAFFGFAGALSLILLHSPGAHAAAPSYAETIEPLLQRYCYDCHGDGEDEGEVQFDRFADATDRLAAKELWEAVALHLDTHVMPPVEEDPQPSQEERNRILSWIDDAVFACDCDRPDPGRVTIRRLNRAEYDNTIRDLLGVDLALAKDFPPDDSGYGFDNIGDVLSLSPIMLEKYERAAEQALAAAIDTGPPPTIEQVVTRADLIGGETGDHARLLGTEAEDTTATFIVESGGKYLARIRVSADQAGSQAARLGIVIDGAQVEMRVVTGRHRGELEDIELPVTLEPGEHRVAARFLNDFYDPGAKTGGDRNLFVHAIALKGPVDVTPVEPPPSHRRVFPSAAPGNAGPDEQRSYARGILARFALKAFRRPVRKAELDRLMDLFDLGMREGESVEASVALALRALLISPSFLFRGEARAPSGETPAGPVPIDEYALATRLSYFLWSSMPDDRLFRLAAAGKLRKSLADEVPRMLGHRKAHSFVENFAGQWLQLRDLDLVRTEAMESSRVTSKLLTDMRRETELLFRHVLVEDRPVLELLDADYTFINGRLARHYRIEGVTGPGFRRVPLTGTPRRGLLTHASILTVTSEPNRTSPVRRGKFVLERILHAPSPNAPATVPDLEETKAVASENLRDRLERHRSKTQCIACHRYLDPPGLALEHFGPDGRWRARDGKAAIDASGTLISGESFVNARELIGILTEEKRDAFVEAFVEQLLIYALGRGLEYYDQCAVNEITERARAGEHRMGEIILGIIESVPFQMHRPPARREHTESVESPPRAAKL